MTVSSNNKACDLCQSQNFQLVEKKDRRGGGLETVICRQCGLVVHAEIPTSTEVEQFYESDYRQEYHGEKTPSNRRVFRAWMNGQRILHRLSEHVNADSQIFDIGAGIGCVVKSFQHAGFENASGIEPNNGFQWYSENRLHANIKRGFLFEQPAEQQYDLILLNHVIEHFRSPREALEHIHQMLNADGLLYLECPNLYAPFAAPGRLFHFAHIHNFTPFTLQELTRLTGFEVVKWFAELKDPNLQILLRKTDIPDQFSVKSGYEESMDALQRYNWLTYHSRQEYISTRISKLASYVREQRIANRFVSRLLAEIAVEQSASEQDSMAETSSTHNIGKAA